MDKFYSNVEQLNNNGLCLCRKQVNDLYKILIIGMGNLLMSDDGLGVLAIKELHKRYKQQAEICCLEIGTSILNYVTDIGKAETLIAIDAIAVGNRPGTIYRIYANDAYLTDRKYFFMDIHVAGIHEAIALSRELTGLPSKVFIYGIEPHTLKEGFFISHEVKTSLKKLLDIVQRDIDSILKKEIR